MDNDIKSKLNQIHGKLSESLGQIKANTGYDLQNGYHVRMVTENTIPKMDIRIRQDNGLKTGHLVRWDYLSDPDDPSSYISRESSFSELPGHIIEVHRKGHFDVDYLTGHISDDHNIVEESQGKFICIKDDIWTVLNENKRPIFSGTGGVDGANLFLKETKI